MIMFVGDLHGNMALFWGLRKVVPHNVPLTIVQVGDFGFYPGQMQEWNARSTVSKPFPWKVYAIDGNHEHYPLLRGKDVGITEMAPNLFYVSRGTVLNIDGYDIGFLGGAESVDKAWRVENVSWFADERVTDEQANKLLNKKIDIFVAHCPPARVIGRNFPKLNPYTWGLPQNWQDVSSQVVDRIWTSLGQPVMFCGHMHKPILDGNCRILDIDEVFFIPPKNSDKPLKLQDMPKSFMTEMGNPKLDELK